MRRIDGVDCDAILPAIVARLSAALDVAAPPRVRLVVDGVALGRLDGARAARLAAFRDVFDVRADRVTFVAALRDAASRTAAIAQVAQALRHDGALAAWRDERYAVATTFDAPPAFTLERGAARWFGMRTYAAHVNGHVDAGGEASLWFARRSATKAVDPGMLDNLVGGGIAAGERVADTVIREAWEEAGIPAPLAARARPCGAVRVHRTVDDGWQDETVFVHDLALPPDFVPAPQDGEALDHRRVPLVAAATLLAQASGPDQVTVDASLVALDFLLRHGAFGADAPRYAEAAALRGLPAPR